MMDVISGLMVGGVESTSVESGIISKAMKTIGGWYENRQQIVKTNIHRERLRQNLIYSVKDGPITEEMSNLKESEIKQFRQKSFVSHQIVQFRDIHPNQMSTSLVTDSNQKGVQDDNTQVSRRTTSTKSILAVTKQIFAFKGWIEVMWTGRLLL